MNWHIVNISLCLIGLYLIATKWPEEKIQSCLFTLFMWISKGYDNLKK